MTAQVERVLVWNLKIRIDLKKNVLLLASIHRHFQQAGCPE